MNMGCTTRLLAWQILLCACHNYDIKARLLDEEEALFRGLSLYHWHVRYHRYDSLDSLDIDKLECHVAQILIRP